MLILLRREDRQLASLYSVRDIPSVFCQRANPSRQCLEMEKGKSDQSNQGRNNFVGSGSAARGWNKRLVASWRTSRSFKPASLLDLLYNNRLHRNSDIEQSITRPVYMKSLPLFEKQGGTRVQIDCCWTQQSIRRSEYASRLRVFF